jgi:hypothetical protein
LGICKGGFRGGAPKFANDIVLNSRRNRRRPRSIKQAVESGGAIVAALGLLLVPGNSSESALQNDRRRCGVGLT